FFSSRRRHTRWPRDWSSDVCSSDLVDNGEPAWPPTSAATPCSLMLLRREYEVNRPASEDVRARPAQVIEDCLVGTAGFFQGVSQIGRASCRERVWMGVVGG